MTEVPPWLDEEAEGETHDDGAGDGDGTVGGGRSGLLTSALDEGAGGVGGGHGEEDDEQERDEGAVVQAALVLLPASNSLFPICVSVNL